MYLGKLLVAQAEIICAGQLFRLCHTDRVETHSCKDERYQGETDLPIEIYKASITAKDKYKDELHQVVACQDTAVEDRAALLQREVLEETHKHSESAHQGRYDE